MRKISLVLTACLVLTAATVAANKTTAAEPRLFAVEVKTGPNWDSEKSANEQAYFREHSANLKHLRDDGRIVMGARYSDVGLIIISAASADAVRAMMDEDPSIEAGTFVYAVHDMYVFYPWTSAD